MSETVHTLTSAHLRNERPIWVRPPCEPLSARNLAVFLDGEFYREHVDASAVLDALQGKVADSWIVFVSMASAEARWLCCVPFPTVIVQARRITTFVKQTGAPVAICPKRNMDQRYDPFRIQGGVERASR